MRICLILEGSYPYVAGGVSSWMHDIIKRMPQHEFVIWAIGANESSKGKYAYELPSNVVHVEEVFLDSVFKKQRTGKPPVGFTKEQFEEIRKMISCENPDWNTIFQVYCDGAADPVDFLLDPAFLKAIKEVCRAKYSYTGFTDFFWTLRSMFLPLLYLMHSTIPEADLYHSISCGYAGVLATIAARKYDKPMVVTEHGIYTREREEEILRANWVKPEFKPLWIDLFYMFSRCAYQNADVVTCLYQHAAQQQRELGCPEDKQMVIPNGVNTELFGNVPIKNPDGYIDVGAVVRIVPIKDIKTMLFAFAIASAGVDKLRLHIMGPAEENPEYYRECLELKEALGLNNVIFTGRVKTWEYLEKIDFTLLTSISEGMPLSILEGMAAGRPAIATNVGSCSELIYGTVDDFGDAGIVVPAMHQRAIAEAILKLATNPSLIRTMGDAGQKRVFTYFKIEDMVKNYLVAYDRACERHARERSGLREQSEAKKPEDRQE